MNLESISWISRNVAVGILAIFNTEHGSKGYGSDAMIVLLDMAFSILDLHMVYLWVEVFNERAINFYTKLGFSVQGKMREMAYRNGKRCDVVIMDILQSEYLNQYGILPKNSAV